MHSATPAALVRALVHRLLAASAKFPAAFLRTILRLWRVLRAGLARLGIRQRCSSQKVLTLATPPRDRSCTTLSVAPRAFAASAVPRDIAQTSPIASISSGIDATDPGPASTPAAPTSAHARPGSPYTAHPSHLGPAPKPRTSYHAYFATSPVSDHADDALAAARPDALDGAMRPMTTTYVRGRRYPRAVSLRRTTAQKVVIPRMTLDFTQKRDLRGWTMHIHPEGERYFYHAELHLFTGSDLTNAEILDAVEEHAHTLTAAVRERCPALDMGALEGSLFVDADGETEEGKTRWICQYYLVDLDQRVLFWLQDFDATADHESLLRRRLQGIIETEQLVNVLEAHYWSHWELFPYPHHKPLDKGIMNEAIVILAQNELDALSSPDPNAQLLSTEIQAMLTSVQALGADGAWDVPGGSPIFVVAQIMSLFAHDRALRYAGQDVVRFLKDPLELADVKRTWSFAFVSAIMLFVPEQHYRNFAGLFLNQPAMLSIYRAWEQLLVKHQADSQNFTVLATVLLATNMALLAVPTVDGGFTSYRTPIQILSYVSTTASVGSILTGLFLQHYLNWSPGVMDAFSDARRNRDYVQALESLAIVYSLPYANLMWAMLTFLAAFATMVLDGTGPAPRGAFGAVLALVLAVIAWCGVRLRGGLRAVAADVVGVVPRSIAATGRAGSAAYGAGRRWWAGTRDDERGGPSRVASRVEARGTGGAHRAPTLPLARPDLGASAHMRA